MKVYVRKYITDNFMDRDIDFCISLFVVVGK